MNKLKLNLYRTEDNENYQQTTQCITKPFHPVALMFSLIFSVTNNRMLLQEKSNKHWEVDQNVLDSTLGACFGILKSAFKKGTVVHNTSGTWSQDIKV